ncbi:DNA alkylation repair protein [Vaginisenegalia massiliensis]|uniref:DNA alkylation repair protein n=1 Tax=Vaginisenegalia massiliensis TaxID=2058294 RepID=UPI000F542552|nr:DNA alkylation repair protein [Vaginisenegalia massiliensis]
MIEQLLTDLATLGKAATVRRYEKNGEPKPYFGVSMADISKMAKKYQGQDLSFKDLWLTGNLDAQLVAIQLFKPNDLAEDEIALALQPNVSVLVLDKFCDKILAKRSDAAQWQEQLLKSDEDRLVRLGWGLRLRQVIAKQLPETEVESLLTEIEAKLGQALPYTKWNMNRTMVEIALHYPDFRPRVLAAAQKIGAYQDMKVAKGCTSAYAPDWIAAVLRRQEK